MSTNISRDLTLTRLLILLSHSLVASPSEGTPSEGTTPVPDDPERVTLCLPMAAEIFNLKSDRETLPQQDQYLLKDSKKLKWWTNNPNLKHQTEFYLFNVTNPDEVLKGDKPILVELGPYIFEEKRTYNIDKWDDRNEFLRLKFGKSYFHAGGKSLDDKVTVLNVPLTSVYNIVSNWHSLPLRLAKYYIYLVLKDQKKYPVFVTHTVNDLLFNGYHDAIVDRIKEDLDMAHKFKIDLKIPASIDQNGRFSFMASVSS